MQLLRQGRQGRRQGATGGVLMRPRAAQRAAESRLWHACCAQGGRAGGSKGRRAHLHQPQLLCQVHLRRGAAAQPQAVHRILHAGDLRAPRGREQGGAGAALSGSRGAQSARVRSSCRCHCRAAHRPCSLAPAATSPGRHPTKGMPHTRKRRQVPTRTPFARTTKQPPTCSSSAVSAPSKLPPCCCTAAAAAFAGKPSAASCSTWWASLCWTSACTHVNASGRGQQITRGCAHALEEGWCSIVSCTSAFPSSAPARMLP